MKRPRAISLWLSVIAGLLVTVSGLSATAQASQPQDLAAVRAATSQFHRVGEAQARGYQAFLGCLEQPGVGGMGYHYVNFSIVDLVVDPLAPESMVYAPGPAGQLQLAAVEYIVPADDWDATHADPPSLFGETFERNNTFGIYALHAWVWQHNTLGLFADWNPAVSCRN